MADDKILKILIQELFYKSMLIPVEVEMADLKAEDRTSSLDCSKDDDRHDDGRIAFLFFYTLTIKLLRVINNLP